MKLDPRISCITLGVQDVERARRFYEKLGWKPGGMGDEKVCFFQLNGLVLALFDGQALAEDAGRKEDDTCEGFRGMALAYNVRTQEEVAQILALAEESGGKILKPAQKAFWGGHYGYFADPDDHVWEVAFNPIWPLDDKGNISLPKT